MPEKPQSDRFSSIEYGLIKTTMLILLSVVLLKIVWAEIEPLVRAFGILP